MFLRRFRRPPSAAQILRFHAALEKMSIAESPEALLNVAFQEATLLTDAEVASLFLLDEEKEELVLKKGSGGSLSRLSEIRRRIDEGILGYVAARKAPLLVKDIHRDSRFNGHRNGSSGYRTSSFIIVPILLKGELKGLLSLTDKKSGKPFTRKDLEWVALLGHCVALTMEKNSLAAELKGHRDALEESRKGTTDLEEKKRRLESELEVSQKMAAIGKLAAGIAHELNNPLDGTLRYLHLSLSHLREGDTIREYLLEVKQGLDRMVNIVKNLLAFSRRQSIREKRVDLHEALNNVLSNLTDTFLPFRVDVIKAYHPDLPLLIDKGVDQIFTNIIKNAFEAMPNGGVLKIATMMNDREITVRISDTGSGIPKEQKRFIFEPFFTTKEIDKGCGLGLSICYELMQAYEGRIEFESEENRGTTFLLYFPLKVVAREPQLAYAR